MQQESGRHSEALDAITKYLDMGTYSEWDEEKKLEFLTRELKSKRPLVPPTIQVMCLDSISATIDPEHQNLSNNFSGHNLLQILIGMSVGLIV